MKHQRTQENKPGEISINHGYCKWNHFHGVSKRNEKKFSSFLVTPVGPIGV